MIKSAEAAVERWLEMEDGNPGHQFLTEEIVKEEPDSGVEETKSYLKLSKARKYQEKLILFVDSRPSDFHSPVYDKLRLL